VQRLERWKQQTPLHERVKMLFQGFIHSRRQAGEDCFRPFYTVIELQPEAAGAFFEQVQR